MTAAGITAEVMTEGKDPDTQKAMANEAAIRVAEAVARYAAGWIVLDNKLHSP